MLLGMISKNCHTDMGPCDRDENHVTKQPASVK